MNRRRFLGFLAALPLMRLWPNAGGKPWIPVAAPLTYRGAPFIPDLVRPDQILAIADLWLKDPRYQARLEHIG